MKQKSSAATPRLVQLVFIVGVIVFFVVQLATTVYYNVTSIQPGAHADTINTVVWYVAQSFIILAVLLGVVHLTRHDRALSVHNVFQSFVLALAAGMVFSGLAVLTSFLNFLIPHIGTTASGAFWWYTLISFALPFVVSICGLVAAILTLRRRKQW